MGKYFFRRVLDMGRGSSLNRNHFSKQRKAAAKRIATWQRLVSSYSKLISRHKKVSTKKLPELRKSALHFRPAHVVNSAKLGGIVFNAADTKILRRPDHKGLAGKFLFADIPWP